MYKTRVVFFVCILFAALLTACTDAPEPIRAVQNYTVTFEPDGGFPAPDSPVTVRKGEKLSEPADMIKEGFVFEGWFTESVFENKWDFNNNTVTNNIILHANWLRTSPGVLPKLMVNTSGGVSIQDKVNWIPSTYELSIDGTVLHSGGTGIRGRGNSTWNMEKKPYNLNLNVSTPILGFPTHRRWALLANYADKTLLRTDLAFKMGNIFDNMVWVPRSEHIEFYLNGNYQGLYQITENVRVDLNRVNINPISTANPDGGFLLEICQRMEDPFHWWSTLGFAFNCSSPDSGLNAVIPGTQTTLFDKIKSYIFEVEDTLRSHNLSQQRWKDYLDIDSFIDFYLVNEIAKDEDAHGMSSIYMYYNPATGKLHKGPIWDFDISMGNYKDKAGEHPEGFHIKNSIWYERLFREQDFVLAVKRRWNEKKAEVQALTHYLDERIIFLEEAQERNFERWPILDRIVWPNVVALGSHAAEVEYLKTWLNRRIAWLDAEINKL